MSFSDFHLKRLEEMSIAGYGDWTPSKEMVGTKSALVVKKYWKECGEIIALKSGLKYKVLRLKNEFIAGNFITTSTDDELFEVVFKITLTEQTIISRSFKIKPLMNVDGVFVTDTVRGDGIAISMYKFLVKEEKLNILGDEIQYFGARKLWARLSKVSDVKVDIIDISKEEFIEKDVVLHHGSEDWDFDNRVWSYTVQKKDVRLILRDFI